MRTGASESAAKTKIAMKKLRFILPPGNEGRILPEERDFGKGRKRAR
jgi:hypothetical protein